MNLLQALFGVKYFGFIAAAWSITLIVLVVMVLYVLVVQSRRRSQLNALETAGIKRASRREQ